MPQARAAAVLMTLWAGNIFDILLGLGFPWFLQLAVLAPGATLYVGDPGATLGLEMPVHRTHS